MYSVSLSLSPFCMLFIVCERRPYVGPVPLTFLMGLQGQWCAWGSWHFCGSSGGSQ